MLQKISHFLAETITYIDNSFKMNSLLNFYQNFGAKWLQFIHNLDVFCHTPYFLQVTSSSLHQWLHKLFNLVLIIVFLHRPTLSSPVAQNSKTGTAKRSPRSVFRRSTDTDPPCKSLHIFNLLSITPD